MGEKLRKKKTLQKETSNSKNAALAPLQEQSLFQTRLNPKRPVHAIKMGF
jgi:hypothetical protein